MDSDGDGHGDNNEASTVTVEESAAKHHLPCETLASRSIIFGHVLGCVVPSLSGWVGKGWQ